VALIIVKIGKKSLQIKDCRGLKSIKGLMFSKMKNIDGALISGNSIWMPFVKHNLDLFFLDKNFYVTSKQKAVPIRIKRKTWKIYSDPNARYCLEIKHGLIDMEKIKIGQKIEIRH